MSTDTRFSPYEQSLLQEKSAAQRAVQDFVLQHSTLSGVLCWFGREVGPCGHDKTLLHAKPRPFTAVTKQRSGSRPWNACISSSVPTIGGRTLVWPARPVRTRRERSHLLAVTAHRAKDHFASRAACSAPRPVRLARVRRRRNRQQCTGVACPRSMTEVGNQGWLFSAQRTLADEFRAAALTA